MVRIALKGFTKRWDVFVKCIVGREKLPEWSRLWDDSPKRRFERELWVGKSVRRWSKMLLLHPNPRTRRRKI